VQRIADSELVGISKSRKTQKKDQNSSI